MQPDSALEARERVASTGGRSFTLRPLSFPSLGSDTSDPALAEKSIRPLPAINGRYNPESSLGARRNAVEQAERDLAAVGGLVRASYLTVYPDGRLIQLSLPDYQEHRVPEKRGKVAGMSDASRRRLMVELHKLVRDVRNPAFVTLTFPDEAIPTVREAKKMLATLIKRWKRRSGRVCGVWRVEAHPERSERLGKVVPHFHLLVWQMWIDREQLSRDWSEIVCGDSNQTFFWKHLAAGTKVQSPDTFRGVAHYAAKYVSKDEEWPIGEDSGRVWGIFNGEAMPRAVAVTIKLTSAQVVRVVRYIKRFLYSRRVETEWMPTSIYHDCPTDILRVLNAVKQEENQ